VRLLPRHQLPAFSPLPAKELITAVKARLRDGGREVELARILVAQQYAADDVLLTDSGRAALQWAIASTLERPDDTVALPAFQCFEVASAAVGVGCRIMLYDVDPDTLGPDFESLEAALKLGVRTLVVAPLYGFPIDWETAMSLATAYGARVIEDAAQAHGAEWRNRPVGALGSLSVLSFGRGKGWTGGSGGAVCIRGSSGLRLSDLPRPKVTQELRLLALDAAQWAFGRPSLYSLPAGIPAFGLGETRYRAPTEPQAITALAAALLRRTVVSANTEKELRRANADVWRATLPSELSHIRPIADAAPSYLRLPVRVDERIAAGARSGVARRVGIARSYPKPLNELRELAPQLIPSREIPQGARALARQLLTLPTHSCIADVDRRSIASLFKSWLRDH
jgi:dTDP-4-amino-4,6-dideoxygalactose transaminase